MTTRASWYLKGKTSLDLNEEEMTAVSQLDHMQTICTSLQTDDHTNTPSLIFSSWMGCSSWRPAILNNKIDSFMHK